MSATALMLAIASLNPPEPSKAGEFYAAIWDDIVASAMISNGDALAAVWYRAGSVNSTPANLHIRELKCSSGGRVRKCTFDLLRDGGNVLLDGLKASALLSCKATFVLDASSNRWAIKHYPPSEDHVHSQSTMECKHGREAKIVG